MGTRTEELTTIKAKPEEIAIRGTESTWLRVPEDGESCLICGLTGREIRAIQPPRRRRMMRTGAEIVTFRTVKIPGCGNVLLVKRSDLMRWIELGGEQKTPPLRFNRFFRRWRYRHRDFVNDAQFDIVAGPYCIGEEDILEAELQRMEGSRVELAYTRKSVTIIRRRRSSTSGNSSTKVGG